MPMKGKNMFSKISDAFNDGIEAVAATLGNIVVAIVIIVLAPIWIPAWLILKNIEG